MNRRRFLSTTTSVTGATVLAGCFTDSSNSEEPPPTEQNSTPEAFKPPSFTVRESQYDWKSGQRTVQLQINLNSAEYVKIGTDEYTSSGEYQMTVSDTTYSIQARYPREDYELSKLITLDSDDTEIQNMAQVRLMNLFATNGFTDTTDETELKRREYTWGSGQLQMNIPQRTYEYYKNRYRVPEYGAYGADPYDKDIINSIINSFDTFGSKREKVSELLKFVQSMEYTQDSVATGYNEYPKFPVETLVERGGDCEDTVILLAEILYEMGYGVRLLILPDDNHMALGVKGSSDISGTYYEQDGNRYYYVETTGENWEIGQKPDGITGDNARLEQITGHPTLTAGVQTDGITEGGAPKFRLTVNNFTEYYAEEVKIDIAFHAENGEQLSHKQVTIGSLKPDSEWNDTEWLTPPDKDRPVKLIATLYESNHKHDSFESELLEPEPNFTEN